MTAIVLSKGVHRCCNKDEIAYVEKSIREMVDEMEAVKPPMFMPWPCTNEEKEKYKDCQVQVTFLPVHPGDLNRLVMIIPLHTKEDDRNIWYVQMKDEFGKIVLDIHTPLLEGHHRVKK